MNFVVLYIDPGTGAMLFSVIMGILGAAYFVLQKLYIKIKFLISAGKVKQEQVTTYQYVIFSDSKRYWNVFAPICREFEKRKITCEYWTNSHDDPALNENFKYVNCRFLGEGNKPYAILNLMKADICLSTTPGLNVYQWKKSRDVKCYVHITHDMGELVWYKMFGIDYYDAVLCAGVMYEKGIREIESLRSIYRKELVTVGSVYLDALFEKRNECDCNNICNNECTKTVLLAPTWGINSVLNRFGGKIIEALSDTGYNIIIRPHPQSFISETEIMKKLMEKYPENEKLEWNRDNDNFEVLSRADIMISDYSSVIFDYTFIFEKPIIFANTNIDTAPYDAAWLDRPTWNIEVLKELGEELTEKKLPRIKSIIDEVIDNPKYYEGIVRARDYCWEYRGQAAEKAVDYLIKKRGEL